MNQKIYSENLQLSLDTFIQRMYLINKADNPQLILKIALKWTNAQPLLTKKLLQHILYAEKRIVEGEEAVAVEKIIKNNLLKKFTHDDLTLGIRKSLYQRNLEKILEENQYHINGNIELYLSNLQKKLGLTDRDCQTIKNQHPIFKRYERSRSNKKRNRQQEKKGKAQLLLTGSSEFKSGEQPWYTTEERPPEQTTLSKAWFWLLLGIPLLFLGISSIPRVKNSNVDISKFANLQQEKLCVDLSSRRSPRMSLGEKLLTKDYSHINSASTMMLYEGMGAFARCEFSSAQEKFKEALVLEKNNPEALIYYNNSKAIAQEHFKIGVSVPLGSKPDIAWEILRGVAQAQAEINQEGGIQDKQLLIQVVSDDNDPYIVKQVAKQLAAENKILAVIGHNDSNSSLVAADIYQQQGLVAISPTSTSTKLSGIGSYILRTIPSVSALARKLADYASLNPPTKVAICSDSSDSASTSFVQEFKSQMTENGGKTIQIGCDFSQNNYNAGLMLDEAIAQGANTMLLAPSVNNMEKAIAIAKVNQKRLPLLGNHSLYTAKTIELGQDEIAGMVIPAPWLPDSTVDSDFAQTTQQYWGGAVNWRTAMAYDATGAIIQGLQNSKNRNELRTTLTKPEFQVDGATGKFHFEQGDRFGKVQLAHIETSPKGAAGYQFSQLDIEED